MTLNSDKANIKLFSDFDKVPVKLWQELYNRGANYNLSYEWCSLWFKYFGKNKKLRIITIWEGEELRLLAPFYSVRERLSLIGAKPDLYDEFDILYTDEKYLDKLFDYIEEKKLEINFKHVNSESKTAKFIIKKMCQKGLKKVSNVTETKPYTSAEFSPKRKMKDDIKRCKNNAVKLYGDDLAFKYKLEKEESFIDEFISLHKKRWNGGLFVKKANVEAFIKELFLKTDVVLMSRLSLSQSDKTVAYHLGYLDSNDVLWSSLPAYNTEFKPVSPGKVLLYNLISEAFNNQVKRFDFGRGSEPYKNWFSNNESVLFNIETYNNRVIVIKIRNLIEKILKKMVG